jgi:HlyD family secretion protein
MGKKFLIGLVLAILAIVLICAFGGRVASKLAPTPTPTPKGTATSEEPTITAKGEIVPARYASLSFPTGGTLSRLMVNEGDLVEAGQVLAQLNTTDLELAVRAAEDALALAEAQLTQVTAPPRPEEIAIAQANYESALAQYEKLKAGASEQEIIVAQAALEKAEAALRQAQAAYDAVAWVPGVGATPQSLNLQLATIDYKSAKAQYERLKAQPREEDLKVAWSNVKSAKAQLDLKKAGPRPEDIAVAEAHVRQARTSLEQAKANLEKAKLTAPFAGTVVSIAAREGEMVAPDTPIIVLADLSRLQVKTTDLDELSVARVKVGDSVKITVNAFDNKVLSGKVVAIAPRGEKLPTGDIAYTVTIALDEQDPELRWGMTVKVEFQK